MQVDLILIDDDEIVRMTWEMAANMANKKLLAFSSTKDFDAQIGLIHKNTEIYVDSILPNGEKGELYAKKLAELGFTNLYLTTGHNRSHFDEMPWIKAILGKAPPFQS